MPTRVEIGSVELLYAEEEKPGLLRLYNSLGEADRVNVAKVSMRIWQLDPGSVGERPVVNTQYMTADKTMETFTMGLVRATMVFRDHPNMFRRMVGDLMMNIFRAESEEPATPQTQTFAPFSGTAHRLFDMDGMD
jgi:hypothetical protein